MVYIIIILYTRENGGACRVVTKEGPASLQVNLIGPHPILQHFLDRMTFFRIVNSCLAPVRESLLDHASTLSVFIQNILLSPAPLYRISEWAAPVHPEALGLSEVQKRALNDDRVARSLEALASFRAGSLFFRLALHMIKEFEIHTGRIHHDTTTVTFSGRYETSLKEPQITYGINKDHRPDLKQLVFGLNVASDGAVPISHDVFSGNRTDDTIHVNNVEHLRRLLGRDDFIYVADSKLATRKNMGQIDGYGGKFVTVLPRTRAEDKGFRDQLRLGKDPVRWRKIAETPNKRHENETDTYWSTSDGVQKTEEGYRIVWCRSSQKMNVDAQAREINLKKAEVLLFDLKNRLNRGKLRRRKAIRMEIRSILQERDCEDFLAVEIIGRSEREKKRRRRGRPGKNDPVRWVTTTLYDLEIRRNQDALKAERRTDGVFPLATNLGKTYGRKETLLIYKYQPYVEKRHALFKTELEVAPVYLKKPKRVAGLIHATFLAMTLDALIERTLRQGMKQMELESLPILPEGRPTKTPTTARLLEMFSGVSWHEFKRGEETVVFPIRLSSLQRQLLKLLGMDTSSYS
jgi:transposase